MKTARTHNATSHGLYAHDVVLPWEDSQEFATFHEGFRQDLNPLGPLEEEAVHELADLHWRKRRLRLGQILPFYKERTPAELTRAAKHGPKKLIGYLAQQSPSASKKTSELREELVDKDVRGRPAPKGWTRFRAAAPVARAN